MIGVILYTGVGYLESGNIGSSASRSVPLCVRRVVASMGSEGGSDKGKTQMARYGQAMTEQRKRVIVTHGQNLNRGTADGLWLAGGSVNSSHGLIRSGHEPHGRVL